MAPTRRPTRAPTRQPSRPPTKAPTRAPVSPSAASCVPRNVSLIQQFGTIAYSKVPITIVPGSQTGTSVTVSIEQVWKSSSISWIATRFTDPALGGATVCPKKNEVSPGFVNYSAGGGGAYELRNFVKSYGTTITAACVNGLATVEVYVHDGQFDGQPDFEVPSECSPSRDRSKKIGYRFSVPCSSCPTDGLPIPQRVPPTNPTNCKSPTRAPVRAPTRNPTRAPVRPPTPNPTKIPTRGPTKIPTRSPTKRPTLAPARPTRGGRPWW